MHRASLTPSLYVPDIESTTGYYQDQLGFDLCGIWEEQGVPVWADMCLGDAHIWFFSQPLPGKPEPGMSGTLYLFVDDVDAFAKTLSNKILVRWGPEDQPYGLRELGIEDLNGYMIVFANDV